MLGRRPHTALGVRGDAPKEPLGPGVVEVVGPAGFA